MQPQIMIHTFIRCQLSLVLAVAAFLGACNEKTFAQTEDAELSEPLDEKLLDLQQRLRSPRDTVTTFLQSMDDRDFESAYDCLDLSELDAETAAAKERSYAVKLQLALEVCLEESPLTGISDNPETEAPYAICQDGEFEGIKLVPAAGNLWKFSRSTVALLDGELFDDLLARQQATAQQAVDPAPWSFPLWLQKRFDESWWGTTFLLKDYQWICLLVLIAIGFLVGQLARWFLDYVTRIWFRITRADVDDQPRRQLWTPVVSLIHILVWYYGTTLIDLPTGAMQVILPVLKFFTVIAAVWTAFRAINLLQNYLAKKARTTVTRYDDSLVPLVCSALKLVSLLLGVVLFVDVFDKDWKAVLGGFGVAGIAVAIAAKDMLGNVFGSVTVLADRPFEIGDWVIIDGKVEGSVEQVGIRSSRLRTFHSSEIIVPNSLLTTAIVDNMGRRRYRRMKTKLQVRYDTPVERLDEFCRGVREIIQESHYLRNENAHVYVHEFGESSIDILLYVFFDCGDWETELRERHCLLTDILRLAERLGIGFAFPTRTVELELSAGGAERLDAPRN